MREEHWSIMLRQLKRRGDSRAFSFTEVWRTKFYTDAGPKSRDDCLICIPYDIPLLDIEKAIVTYTVRDTGECWLRHSSIAAYSENWNIVDVKQHELDVFDFILDALGFSIDHVSAKQNPKSRIWHVEETLVWPPAPSVERCK